MRYDCVSKFFAQRAVQVVARHKERGAMLTLFQRLAVRRVSKPAAVKFTLRMGFFCHCPAEQPI